jgi:repressor LexA
MLTERQESILDFIRLYQGKESVPPSSRIIQSRFKLKSQTSVMRDLAALSEKGLVKQTPDGRWGVVGISGVQTHLFDLPVLGEIPAGLPDIREQLAGERISIDPRVFGIRVSRLDHYFALKVKGDSMINANIVSGDYTICEWCEPRVGDVIAALVDDTTVTLKKLIHEHGRLLLRAANADYPDIMPDRLEAQGVVRGVIRSGVALSQ